MCWCTPSLRTPCCGTPKCHDAAIQAGVLEPGKPCIACHPPGPAQFCTHGIELQALEVEGDIVRGAPCVRCLWDVTALVKLMREARDTMRAEIEAANVEVLRLRESYDKLKNRPPGESEAFLIDELEHARETLELVARIADGRGVVGRLLAYREEKRLADLRR